jgi:hypothetical protein
MPKATATSNGFTKEDGVWTAEYRTLEEGEPASLVRSTTALGETGG